MSSEQQEIKNCFCGHWDKTVRQLAPIGDSGPIFYVTCMGCGAAASGWQPTREAAIQEWNGIMP